MRKLLIIAVSAGLTACATMAGTGYPNEAVMGTNTAMTVAFRQTIRGAIDTVYLAASNGSAQADVGIVYAPHHGYADPQTIVATNFSVTGTAVLRPRVTGENTAGAALQGTIETAAHGEGSNAVSRVGISIPYEPIRLSGEIVSLVVQGSATGVTWRAILVTK